MSNQQYFHVCEFFQTVFTISILFLVGQKIIIILRNFDEKYALQKNKQYQQEIKWFVSAENQIKKQPALQQITLQIRKLQESKAIQEARKNLQNEGLKEKPFQQNNLRQSFLSNQNQMTDRKFEQNHHQYRPTIRKQGDRRKSLTQLSNPRNSQQIQIKDEQQVKDNDETQDYKIKHQGQQNHNKVAGLDNLNLNQKSHQNIYLQSINPAEYNVQQQVSSQQMSDRRFIRYLMKIDNAFDEYIPILISTIVVGMLTQSTFIFSMVCFFGYLFTSLLLNYADLLVIHKEKSQKQSIFSKIQKSISGIFIIILFIDYWIDSQFSQ